MRRIITLFDDERPPLRCRSVLARLKGLRILREMACVTLLTDFGTADGYVGAMKGVITALAPHAPIVDLTHEIEPQQVRAGAWALALAATTFPAGTIHVAVVDPEVGSARRALLLRAGGMLFVGPDNGLLSWVACADEAQAWALDREQLFRGQVAPTFHGRDVFAPVAGHLAAGMPAERCGTPVTDWVRLWRPQPTFLGDAEVLGEVIHVDRFGNLVTNLAAETLSDATGWHTVVAGRRLGPLGRFFADVEPGELVAYVGSAGYLEIAVRNGSAGDRLFGSSGAALGEEVRLCCSA